MPAVKETQLRYLEYLHREDGYRHHRYDEEMLQYHLLREGDQAAVPESVRMWTSGLVGKTSEDTIRNRKYLFVASITLACRAAILGGLEEQRSYDISDLYIQRVDKCATLEEITTLHEDMFAFYVQEVAAAKKKNIYSKPGERHEFRPLSFARKAHSQAGGGRGGAFSQLPLGALQERVGLLGGGIRHGKTHGGRQKHAAVFQLPLR